MKCNKCGNIMPDDAVFCSICGEAIKEAEQAPVQEQPPVAPAAPVYEQQPPVAPVAPVYEQQPVNQGYQAPPVYEVPPVCNPQGQPTYVTPMEENVKPAKGLATASLILGILSIVICCLGEPLGVAALVMGIIAKKKGNSTGTVGIITGIIGVVISTIVLIIISLSGTQY